ncbi:DUF3846 domain-containing protein [Arthrobacter sp. UYEF20]|uniref:DUF3846 domain-containing protein n=1 Tax=Arthrobacter sp. UYEF20 TaxID=1756363 RepID=UPI0033996B3D
MSTTCTALIVPAKLAEPVRIEPLDACLETLQRMVDGDVDSVQRGDWDVYFNSVGKLSNLPPNLRAGQLMHECGLDLADVVRGTAVFLGHTEHGGAAELPRHLGRRAAALFDIPLAA